MKTLVIALVIIGSIAACTSMQTYNGHRFTNHEGRVDALYNTPDHGFMQVEKNDQICDGNNRLTAGYVVHIRKPNSGETKSEYDHYIDAEKVRASVCSKAALWCSTQTHYFCKPDDSACLKDHSGATRNTCKVKVLDGRNKPHLRPITIGENGGSWIYCGSSGDDYESSLTHTVMSNRAWVKDQAKWVRFCEQHRPKEECDLILQYYESPTWFVWADASRWATEILIKEKPTVERDGDRWIATVEVDLGPACPLLESRY